MKDNPITDLRESCAEIFETCRAKGWFGASFWLRVLRIKIDRVAALLGSAAQSAYSAEAADLEADKELTAAQDDLRAALKDGKLTAEDLPAIRRATTRLKLASRHVRCSARHDHNACEQLTA